MLAYIEEAELAFIEKDLKVGEVSIELDDIHIHIYIIISINQ